MKNTHSKEEFEAIIFTKYLIGERADKKTKELYIRALDNSPTILDKNDTAILSFLTKHPSTLGFLDAGLAVIKPHSEVRRRLYLIFAILESTPLYWKYFIPIQRRPIYLFIVIAVGIRSIYRLLVGSILVKLVLR